MSNTLPDSAFDFVIGSAGLKVTCGEHSISGAAWSDGEIDGQIAALKVALDNLSTRMKAASRQHQASRQSLFDRSADAPRT